MKPENETASPLAVPVRQGSSSAGTGRRTAVGCLGAFLALVLGIALMVLQSDNILDTWTYCANEATEVAVDTSPHSGAEVDISFGFQQALVYTACFPVGFALGRLVMRRRPRPAAIVVACLLGAAVCAAAFVGDYALHNGEAAGFYLPDRCPGGRPPWWPEPLPMRVG